MPIDAAPDARICVFISALPVSITTATMRAIRATIMTMAQRAISLDFMDVESNCSYNYINGTVDRHGYMWYAIT